MKDLEKKLRAAIVHGHLRTNRPWKKIIIVVEGVYRLVNTKVRWVVDFWTRTFYLFSMLSFNLTYRMLLFDYLDLTTSTPYTLSNNPDFDFYKNQVIICFYSSLIASNERIKMLLYV
jgi:hypothetical protein